MRKKEKKTKQNQRLDDGRLFTDYYVHTTFWGLGWQEKYLFTEPARKVAELWIVNFEETIITRIKIDQFWQGLITCSVSVQNYCHIVIQHIQHT